MFSCKVRSPLTGYSTISVWVEHAPLQALHQSMFLGVCSMGSWKLLAFWPSSEIILNILLGRGTHLSRKYVSKYFWLLLEPL